MKSFVILFQPEVVTAIVLLGVALTGWTSWKEFKGLSAFNLNVVSLLDTSAKEKQMEGHFPHSLLECQSLKKEEEEEGFKIVLNEFLTKIVYPNCTIFIERML